MIASQHVGKPQRGVEWGGIGITSPCSRLAKSALLCGPAKKQSLDLFFKSAGDEGVEITSNTFKYKVWLRGRALSDRTALYGLSIRTDWFSKSFLSKYSLKNQRKSRLPSRAMGRVCNPLSRKKEKKKEADYSPTLLILKSLPSGSHEPQPVFHRPQAQCPFPTQSHWAPWNYQLRRLRSAEWDSTTNPSKPPDFLFPSWAHTSEGEFEKIRVP